ncbi:Uncharacterised protein [Clostridium fallax]|uniref:Uncharacterized protein n=1 Tax=Clostridium fallax TaxID=1533 RepID=A0A1M4YU45_9CLOT|nr:hypothetical protein SAMN05443638_13215 [Clostridium fallax]SQB22176.1 Uncharacterised protein [Clostridium fallax]
MCDSSFYYLKIIIRKNYNILRNNKIDINQMIFNIIY